MNDQETIAAAEGAFKSVGFPHASAIVGEQQGHRRLTITPAPGVDYHVSLSLPVMFPEELRIAADTARADIDAAAKAAFAQ